MPTFNVPFTKTVEISVEADNAEDAIELAESMEQDMDWNKEIGDAERGDPVEIKTA